MRWCATGKRSQMEATLISKASPVSMSTVDDDIKPPVPKAPKLDDDFMGSDSIVVMPETTRNTGELNSLTVLYYQIPRHAIKSAPMERLLSIVGKIFRPDKCSVKDKTFERLMMIK